MNLYDVIKLPKLTEKSMDLKEQLNQFVFEVNLNANKIQIKVRTMNVSGKKKRLGKYQGRKSNRKKALVTLKKGQTIEFFDGA